MRIHPVAWSFIVGPLLAPLSAGATEFAEPPDQPILVQDSMPYERDRSESAARLHVGPALDLRSAEPGLFLALDVGRRSIGFRLAGSAVALGRDDGTAIGSAELWVRPVELGPWSPILGAGAGLRDESQGRRPAEHELSAVAVFRGGFELRLPIAETDARAALSLAAHVPAIVEDGNESAGTSGLLSASLAVGF